MRREPNERERPEGLTPEHWALAMEWQPYVYQLVRRFGAKVMGMDVWLTGDVTKGTHRWITSSFNAYGQDAVSIMEDLEYRGMEGAAVAARDFQPERGYQFSTFLTKVVNNDLRDEFDRWVQTSSNPENMVYADDDSLRPRFEDSPQNTNLNGRNSEAWDPGYERNARPYEAESVESVLTPEVQARLENAMGGLTSKEAWALRMHADGVPADVIAERLGYKGEKSVYKLIAAAKDKARVAYERDPE